MLPKCIGQPVGQKTEKIYLVTLLSSNHDDWYPKTELGRCDGIPTGGAAEKSRVMQVI